MHYVDNMGHCELNAAIQMMKIQFTSKKIATTQCPHCLQLEIYSERTIFCDVCWGTGLIPRQDPAEILPLISIAWAYQMKLDTWEKNFRITMNRKARKSIINLGLVWFIISFTIAILQLLLRK